MLASISRPAPDEYAPYFQDYIRRVPGGDILAILDGQIASVRQLLDAVPEAHADFRIAQDAWSIKEVVGHVGDVERVFAYRALCISRKDPASLPDFDQDAYVRESTFAARSLADLVQEFEFLRRATLLAFRSLTEAASLARGRASGREVSVRALVYIMAGHVYHHLDSLHGEYLAQLAMQ